MSKNKLKTPSYFIKRLRDNGFVVIKLFSIYSKSDPRRWTVLVNPSEASVLITCYTNKNDLNEVLFELNDGGQKINSNFFIKTDSIEVIINYLINRGVSNNTDYPGRDRYIKERLNNYDEGQKSIV
ncbi:hypothetical protein EBR43_10885 [bacterium]|nr:hypothetical protein [bacterium]